MLLGNHVISFILTVIVSKEEFRNVHAALSIRETLPVTKRSSILQISAVVLRYKQIIWNETKLSVLEGVIPGKSKYI